MSQNTQLKLSDLQTSTYPDVSLYRYDLAAAGNDRVLIDAINAKLKRSMRTINGAQSVPTTAQKGVSVQCFEDGSVVYGNEATVASIRNKKHAQEDSAETKADSFVSPGKTHNFRPR